MKRLSTSNMDGNKIINVGTPTADDDAANKIYVDDALLQKATNRDVDITVTVGSGGDYATINEAIEALSELRPKYTNDGFLAEVSLLTGFVMAEQVFARHIDLSWIVITSVDAVVTIDHTAITEELLPEDNMQPAFGAIHNAKLPTIGVQFEYASNTTSLDGCVVAFNSSVTFLSGSGIRKARYGMRVLYSSSASCYIDGMTDPIAVVTAGKFGVDFSDCSARALHVAFNSNAGFTKSKFDNSGGNAAVYAIWNSRIDVYMTSIKNAAGTGVYSRDGSTINARGTDVSGAGDNGYHALHNGRINARYTEDTDAGLAGASNCGNIGVLASNGGYIEAVDQIVTGCGNAGIAAIANSFINASYADVSDSGDEGVVARNASMINFENGIADDVLGDEAIMAESGSTINAQNAVVRRALTAIRADTGGRVVASGANVSGASIIGMSVSDGGIINANGASGASFNRETNEYTGQGMITTNAAPKFEQEDWTWLLGDGDATATGSVTFPKAFSSIPNVQVTLLGTKSGSNPSDAGNFGVGSITLTHTIYNVSATGFSIMIRDTNNTSLSSAVRLGFNWKAKGNQ